MLLQLSPRRAPDSPGLLSLLADCHQRIRHFSQLACDVARRADAPPSEVTEACASVKRYFSQALPLHVADEEESIAPRLRSSSVDVARALGVMSAQHDAHGAHIAQLLHALGELQQAPHDESARLRLATIAQPLQLEFEQHLALEESVLFPAIGCLPLTEQSRIVAELRARRGVR